jgi:1-acyl-sn-glycerol-3-phosphate acyltransferase
MLRFRNLEDYQPRPEPVRYLLGYLALFLGSFLARVRVSGREHIPRRGPFIVAANHFSRLDPALVIYALHRPINFLMASDQTVELFLMWAPWLYGYIPINRTRLAPSTIKQALQVLRRGKILGIFPEGASTADSLRPAKNGVVYLSTVAAAPVLPVGIVGLENVLGLWRRGLRPEVTIRIGKPVGPFSLPRERAARDRALQEIGTEVMCCIAALLPEQHHGCFAGHPRIKACRSGTPAPPAGR